MNSLDKLKECCRMRNLPDDLIHRTIREFGWFCGATIWGDDAVYSGSEGKRAYEFAKKRGFKYGKGELTLENWIDLFYDWCKEEYGN